jgi:hypothetical protein
MAVATAPFPESTKYAFGVSGYMARATSCQQPVEIAMCQIRKMRQIFAHLVHSWYTGPSASGPVCVPQRTTRHAQQIEGPGSTGKTELAVLSWNSNIFQVEAEVFPCS